MSLNIRELKTQLAIYGYIPPTNAPDFLEEHGRNWHAAQDDPVKKRALLLLLPLVGVPARLAVRQNA